MKGKSKQNKTKKQTKKKKEIMNKNINIEK